MELADVLDSKSCGSDTVPVRPRSPAPSSRNLYDYDFFIKNLTLSVYCDIISINLIQMGNFYDN